MVLKKKTAKLEAFDVESFLNSGIKVPTNSKTGFLDKIQYEIEKG